MTYRKFIQFKINKRNQPLLSQKKFIKYRRQLREVTKPNHYLMNDCVDDFGKYNVVKIYCPEAGQWRVVKQYVNDYPVYTRRHGEICNTNSLLLHLAFKLTHHTAILLAHYTYSYRDQKDCYKSYLINLHKLIDLKVLVKDETDTFALLKNLYVNNSRQLRYFYSINNQHHIIHSCNALQYLDHKHISTIISNLEEFLSNQEPLGEEFDRVLHATLDELYQN